MIDNDMYDIKRDEVFIGGTYTMEEYFYTWWNDGEGLWSTANKQVQRRGQRYRSRMGVAIGVYVGNFPASK